MLLVSCVNTASQRWTAYTDRSVRPGNNGSMCLDVAGNLYTQAQAAIHTWWACVPCCRLQTLCRLPDTPPNLVLSAIPFCMGVHMGVPAGCQRQALLHVPGGGRTPTAAAGLSTWPVVMPGCTAHQRQHL